MKKDVFVSYTTANKDVAFAVVKSLEEKGIDCFVAPRDVDPGRPYASNLVNAIDNCLVAILIASKAINGSEHVLNEIDVIIEKNKRLIPFFIEEFDMNDDLRYYLSRTHRIIAYPNEPSYYFDKLYDSVCSYLPHKPEPETTQKPILPAAEQSPAKNNSTTVFNYIRERGIMVNPEDGQRNVSFRTDTFINLLGGIYESVSDIAGIEKADRIFHVSGYESGQNFAERLNDKWDVQQSSPTSFEEKLTKWCEFDSNVGWGKFDISVDIDDEGKFSGHLTINECFIVDKKKKRHICEFIKGYCEGVIETLLGVEVTLECDVCPLKNKFKTMCSYIIRLQDE